MKDKKKHGAPGKPREKKIVLAGVETLELFEKLEFRKSQGKVPYDGSSQNEHEDSEVSNL